MNGLPWRRCSSDPGAPDSAGSAGRHRGAAYSRRVAAGNSCVKSVLLPAWRGPQRKNGLVGPVAETQHSRVFLRHYLNITCEIERGKWKRAMSRSVSPPPRAGSRTRLRNESGALLRGMLDTSVVVYQRSPWRSALRAYVELVTVTLPRYCQRRPIRRDNPPSSSPCRRFILPPGQRACAAHRLTDIYISQSYHTSPFVVGRPHIGGHHAVGDGSFNSLVGVPHSRLGAAATSVTVPPVTRRAVLSSLSYGDRLAPRTPDGSHHRGNVRIALSTNCHLRVPASMGIMTA